MASKKKKNNNLVKMVSTALKTVVCPKTGAKIEKKTGTFYVTKKNPKGLKAATKLEFKKFDPVTRKHEIFKQVKM